MTTPSRKTKTEAVLPKELVERLLVAAGNRVILVGGQSLAYWAAYFEVPTPKGMAFISRDIDFLAESAADFSEVQRFANVLDGYAVFPSKRSLTSLIGQAVEEISDDGYFNVDILHKVLTATLQCDRLERVDTGRRLLRLLFAPGSVGVNTLG